MTGKTPIMLTAGLLAACATLAACNGAPSSPAAPTRAQSAASGSPTAPVPAARATPTPRPAPSQKPSQGSLKALVEPEAGMTPVDRLITGARSSVDLTMYELKDPAAESDLAADAARGITVRVLLDRHLERSANSAAYTYLAARGVHVRWAPARTTFHQKTLTVDGATSVIMTGNLVAEDYNDTRDFAVIDTRPADVAAIAATFNADFGGRGITPPDGADLVWSPTNAQQSVLSVINGATRTLAVEDEEMNDPAVTSALESAARRGVSVQITMTADSEWNSAFAALTAAGAHIRLYPDNSSALYIHAKAIVADAGTAGQEVLVGSQNFSVASLDYNRELSIRSRVPAFVSAIGSTLGRDYSGGAAYAPPAAAKPTPVGSGAAWCTATASVYDAARDENNVYVHSNQPGQDATASADGYSHYYRTDSSGYALIYLNGPPPGARITVTVGGATCTASD